jgi:hypothetical protein
MASGPSDLAERISDKRETFRLPVEAARAKAREILSEAPQGGLMNIIERWRQLPDGQIELTMRRLGASD